MHVISRRKLKDAATRHGDLEGPLDAWFRIAKKAQWRNLAEVRKTFSSADALANGRCSISKGTSTGWSPRSTMSSAGFISAMF
jgi:mRNA-degrading endonuclease HigB of HigAB toxin-antitoxin module